MHSHFDADHEVLGRIRGGEIEAFRFLVIKYRVPLLRLGLKMLGDLSAVEDVLQDTFIKAYKSLDRFEGRSSFKSWLYQIFMNTLKNSCRRKKWVSIENTTIAFDFTGDTSIQHKQMAKLIEKAIQSLPPRQKIAVILRVYEDLSFEEIATVMKCPYDTAKANFRHGLLKLKSTLEHIAQYDLDFEVQGSKPNLFYYQIEEVEP